MIARADLGEEALELQVLGLVGLPKNLIRKEGVSENLMLKVAAVTTFDEGSGGTFRVGELRRAGGQPAEIFKGRITAAALALLQRRCVALDPDTGETLACTAGQGTADPRCTELSLDARAPVKKTRVRYEDDEVIEFVDLSSEVWRLKGAVEAAAIRHSKTDARASS